MIPEPLSAKQRIIMNAPLTIGLSELWVASGTKFGKTFGLSAGMVRKTLSMQGGLLRWIAPIYAQTKIGFKYAKRIFPPPPHTKIDNHDLSLTVSGLDSRLEFKSGKFPEDLEGEGTHANALDEAAKMQQQVYDSTKTTTTVTRGPIIAISTPRGKNWFYAKCMEAKEEMEWAKKKGMQPTKMFITAPSTDNPLVSAAAVEEARRSMPERLFRQYYLAEFMDDGSVFMGYRECLNGPELQFDGPSCLWISPLYSAGTVVIGADWAKTVDYTVFIAFDIVTHEMVGFQRFHKTPYTEAIRKLVLFAKKFSDVIIINHDKTGLGQVIDDQLAYTDLPYEGITFTNAIKALMVGQLITSIEHRSLSLPNWPEMISELESYEVATNAIGTMTYAAVPGKHDDIISAMMLAHAALVQYSDTGADINFMEELGKPVTTADRGKTAGKDAAKIPAAVNPIEAFYRSIREDDD